MALIRVLLNGARISAAVLVPKFPQTLICVLTNQQKLSLIPIRDHTNQGKGRGGGFGWCGHHR